LFLGAIGIRFYHFQEPSGMLLADREYRSALIARGYCFESTNSIPEWRRKVAVINKEREGLLEPPIMELLVSWVYRIVDGEYLWIARIFSSMFWLAGGLFLFHIAKRIASLEASVLVTAYYLFVPLGIFASRSFQPDALMIMLFLCGILLICRYAEQPSMLRLVTAASVSGLTLLIRPLVLFALFGAFISLAVRRKGARNGLVDSQFLIFMIVGLLPAALFYGYGIFIVGFLRWKVETSFMPHLLLHLKFWNDWLLLAVEGVGSAALLGGLLGVPILRQGLPRALLLGLWAGYFVFGLVFTFHAHTHGYYHLQLIPIVALSFSPLIDLLKNEFRQASVRWYGFVPAISAVLVAALFTLHELRRGLSYPRFESKKVAWEIGETVGHSTDVAYLAPHYGNPLEYYGELSGSYWPRRWLNSPLYRRPDERELSIEDRFRDLGISPKYFIVTDLSEFNEHHRDLKEFLTRSASLIAQDDEYLVYRLCAKPETSSN
jgi:hypothetical protein